MLRRVGSASAAKTACATASGAGRGMEIIGYVGQLLAPARDIALVGGVEQIVGHVSESGLHHGQPRPPPLGTRVNST